MSWNRILEADEEVGTPWTSTGADRVYVEKADGTAWTDTESVTLEVEQEADVWKPDPEASLTKDGYMRIVPGDGDQCRLRATATGFIGRWRGRRLPVKS